MTNQVKLTIDGMHCDHCEITVGAALERAGLGEVTVDWRRGEATGTPAASFSEKRAGDEVAEIGYTLTSSETPEETAAPNDDAPAEDYDLLILGSGSAAFGAAIKARDLGARVAMIERDVIGGTCVNIGCVPSKALLRAAEAYWQAGHSPFAGVSTFAGDVDLPALVEQKRGLVDQLRQEKYADLVDFYGIDYIRGDARFVDAETVQVGDRRLRAFRFLIATGADTWVPPINGLDDVDYLTSTTALELLSVPDKLIVVGANAIGLELGQLFTHLGSRVTFVEALDRIAPFEEPEISASLHEHLVSQGATIHAATTATGAGHSGDRYWLDIELDGTTTRLEGNHLLMATGRRARTAGLGLDAAGVVVDQRGHVIVDDTLETSNPAVFAAGDVTAHPQFVYVAALGGNLAAENALRGTTRRIEFRTMPRVTFTTPAIASVGMTESEARDAGHPVITSLLPLDIVPRALVDHSTEGLVKLVADDSTGHLLGTHILAEGAGDVIQAAVMAIKYRATIDEIAETYHPYLTMAEALKLAAQGFGKDVKTLSCCAA
ncbi:MAG: mercury(II) reductase [Armatimonadetes bacterium]|nr:MAG: mercury(II) reductase [Armatimonadota bacterium]